MSQLTLFITSIFIAGTSTAAEIIATIPPLAGMVKMLDPAGNTTCLLSQGSDPHHFQLTPKQVESTGRAALLVRSSRDDGGWLNLNQSSPVIDLWPDQDHAWLSPEAVAKKLPKLADAMIKAFPQQRAYIEKNLKLALANVSRINRSLTSAIAPMQKRGVVMQHPSWRRLFQQHDIPVLDVLESDRHGHEHGPRHLEEALAKIEQHQDAVLVGDIRHSNRSLEWISRHSGRDNILYLDALGQCGESWDELMQRNIDRITGL